MTDDDEPVVELKSGRTLTMDEFSAWLRIKGMTEHDRLVVLDYIDIQREIGQVPVPLGDLPNSVGLRPARDMMRDCDRAGDEE